MAYDVIELLKLLWPLLVIQFGLMVLALLDLRKREKVKGDNKAVWVLVIIIINIIGPVLYFVWGRER